LKWLTALSRFSSNPEHRSHDFSAYTVANFRFARDPLAFATIASKVKN
jgi:hypothetical protein